MKAIRYIKLRTFTQGPFDLIFERSNNPLKRSIAVRNLSHDFTRDFLAQFRTPVDLINAGSNTWVTFITQRCQSSDLCCFSLLIEDVGSGWLSWEDSIDAYACPHVSNPSLTPWDPESQEAVSAVREATMDPSFWQNLSTHFSSETNSEVVSSDNVASIKSIGMLA